MDQLYYCNKCSTVLSPKDFKILKNGQTDSYCKNCRKEYGRLWRENNEKKAKGYYINNREKQSEAAKNWRKANLEKSNELNRKSKKKNLSTFVGRFFENHRKSIKNMYESKGTKSNYIEHLGCKSDFFIKRFPESSLKGNYSFDHIIPRSLAFQLQKRGLMEETELKKLCLAISHYSNIRVIDKGKNTDLSDRINGVSCRLMSDEDLLKEAWSIIKRVEGERGCVKEV